LKPGEFKLYTTDEEFRDAHLSADKGRGKQIQIKRDQLRNLLMDHSNMIGRLNQLGERPVYVEED